MRRTMGGASSRILAAAAELFAERGYRETSIEDIASAAEISRSSLFWHFKSKEGLLQAVIEDVSHGWVEELLEAGNAHRGLAALEAFLDQRGEHYRTQPQAFRLAAVLYGEAGSAESVASVLGPMFVEIEDNVRQAVAQWLAEAIDDGDLRPDIDPETVARVFVAAIHGVAQEWTLDPEGCDLATADEAILQIIKYLRPTVRARQKTRSKRSA